MGDITYYRYGSDPGYCYYVKGYQRKQCDFAHSYFDLSQFSFVSALPDHRFLVWYTEPLTGETTPAILEPTEEEQRPVRKTVRLATVGLGSDRRSTVTAAVTHFNCTDQSFVIEHTDYDSAGGTVDQREAHLTDDLLRGERYDVFLFGSAVKLADSLADKGLFEDMSWIANNTDFISCVRDAYTKDGAVYTLPFTVNIRTLSQRQTFCQKINLLHGMCCMTWNGHCRTEKHCSTPICPADCVRLPYTILLTLRERTARLIRLHLKNCCRFCHLMKPRVIR